MRLIVLGHDQPLGLLLNAIGEAMKNKPDPKVMGPSHAHRIANAMKEVLATI
jgi:hypothetical protein